MSDADGRAVLQAACSALGVQLPSLMSLRLDMTANGTSLGMGTGFAFSWDDRPWLITNRHNLTGRRQDTGEPIHRSAATPDTVFVHHNTIPESRASTWTFEWEPCAEPVVDAEGAPLWLEHPVHGSEVDVVALPIRNVPSDAMIVTYTTHDFSKPLGVGVSQDLSIIGFPYGLESGGIVGVWMRGTVATEPSLDWEGLRGF